MEYLFIVLAIIWFVVKNSVKKEKNNAGKKPGAAAPSAASSVRMTPEEVEARKAEIRAKLQSLQGAAQPQAVSMPAAPAPAAEIPSAKAVRPAAEPAKGDAFPKVAPKRKKKKGKKRRRYRSLFELMSASGSDSFFKPIRVFGKEF